MSPRTGRPKSENPKEYHVKVRLDGKMNAALVEYAKKYDITKTEAVRRGIILILEQEK